eukprot:TRINITY_DN36138_c0_g1_i1.p2 TRINITY_DN36138_c0_g1~~TRINITY_DN36138_c0_g1_i1.p2  ORF type:complete len:130 (-),score=20.67 TRINITY_DN36138_c0_g1_i1:120-509(-)
MLVRRSPAMLRLFSASSPRLLGFEDSVKFVSVASKSPDEFAQSSKEVQATFNKFVADGRAPELTDKEISLFAFKRGLNLGPMEGMSKEDAKEMTDAALADIQDRDPTKHFKADPTRFGDWEKNGICYDF